MSCKTQNLLWRGLDHSQQREDEGQAELPTRRLAWPEQHPTPTLPPPHPDPHRFDGSIGRLWGQRTGIAGILARYWAAVALDKLRGVSVPWLPSGKMSVLISMVSVQ